MRAAITSLGIIRPSAVTYFDEMDSDDARYQTVGCVGRFLMGINIATGVRALKFFSVVSIGYFFFEKYYKDYLLKWLDKFVRGK